MADKAWTPSELTRLRDFVMHRYANRAYPSEQLRFRRDDGNEIDVSEMSDSAFDLLGLHEAGPLRYRSEMRQLYGDVIINIGTDNKARSCRFVDEDNLVELPPGPRLVSKIERNAASTLDFWAAFLPIRIVNEEVGDCLEDIHRRAADGQRVGVWVRVVSAIFWTGLNALRMFLERMGTRKAA